MINNPASEYFLVNMMDPNNETKTLNIINERFDSEISKRKIILNNVLIPTLGISGIINLIDEYDQYYCEGKLIKSFSLDLRNFNIVTFDSNTCLLFLKGSLKSLDINTGYVQNILDVESDIKAVKIIDYRTIAISFISSYNIGNIKIFDLESKSYTKILENTLLQSGSKLHLLSGDRIFGLCYELNLELKAEINSESYDSYFLTWNWKSGEIKKSYLNNMIRYYDEDIHILFEYVSEDKVIIGIHCERETLICFNHNGEKIETILDGDSCLDGEYLSKKHFCAIIQFMVPTIFIWDIEEKRPIAKYDSDDMTQIKSLPNNQILLVGQNIMKIWDYKRHTVRVFLEPVDDYICDIQVTLDGKILLIDYKGQVLIYN